MAYRQAFERVVFLTQVKRINNDPDNLRWKEVLHRLSHGECTEGDIEVLNGLVRSDLSDKRWQDAKIITCENTTRMDINWYKHRSHAVELGRFTVIAPPLMSSPVECKIKKTDALLKHLKTAENVRDVVKR